MNPGSTAPFSSSSKPSRSIGCVKNGISSRCICWRSAANTGQCSGLRSAKRKLRLSCSRHRAWASSVRKAEASNCCRCKAKYTRVARNTIRRGSPAKRSSGLSGLNQGSRSCRNCWAWSRKPAQNGSRCSDNGLVLPKPTGRLVGHSAARLIRPGIMPSLLIPSQPAIVISSFAGGAMPRALMSIACLPWPMNHHWGSKPDLSTEPRKRCCRSEGSWCSADSAAAWM